jgi:hypothetical protein
MDMDSTSSAVALTQVLDVPELLENILSFLPEREILTSVQLVSQIWRSSIVGSPRIQKSLFLPKEKKPAVSPIRFTSDDDVSVFGWPIYGSSVAPNHLFADYHSLHPKCHLDYIVGHFDLLLEKAGSHSTDYGIDVEMLPKGGPAFAHDRVDYRLRDSVQLYATILDKDRGITMGLVHDTIAAMIRSHLRQDTSDIDRSSHLSFGIEGCDGGNTTDSPDRDGGDIDGEGLSDQDDADEVEENDEGDGSDDDDAEDDSVHQEDLEEDKISEYHGEAVDL